MHFDTWAILLVCVCRGTQTSARKSRSCHQISIRYGSGRHASHLTTSICRWHLSFKRRTLRICGQLVYELLIFLALQETLRKIWTLNSQRQISYYQVFILPFLVHHTNKSSIFHIYAAFYQKSALQKRTWNRELEQYRGMWKANQTRFLQGGFQFDNKKKTWCIMLLPFHFFFT